MPYTLGPRVDFEALPTADYRLTLKTWKETIEAADTKFSKRGDVRIEWNWLVSVPGGEDQERRDWTNIPATFAEKSNFVHIAVALGIVDNEKAIEAGATIDPDQGIGKSCIGTIVKALKSDNKTWGDRITQYAPLPATPATPATPKTDMASKLRARLTTLMAFSGDPHDLPADLTTTALKDALQVVGAKPISPKALELVGEQVQLANTMGINEFDNLPLASLTLKDALLLHEKITARLDA